MKTMADLTHGPMKRDTTTVTHFSMWREGSFATFEQMLVSLCCHLWEEKMQLSEQLFNNLQRNVGIKLEAKT